MTAWSSASAGDTEYVVGIGETIWDDGLTLWDLNGNVYQTHWDDEITPYTTLPSGTTIWA